MKYVLHILIALITCFGAVAQNKHIVFDKNGTIQKNDDVKVDTLLLINNDKGIISDTLFIISLEDKHSFFVSKRGKSKYSFFPYMNMQVKPVQREKSTKIIVFERTGFIILTVCFFLLFVSLWWRNKKNMQTLKETFAMVKNYNNRFIDLSKDIKKIEANKLNESLFLNGIKNVIHSCLKEEKEALNSIKELCVNIQNEIYDLNQEKTEKPEELIVLDIDEQKKLDSRINNYHFSPYALNSLEKEGIVTVFDLLSFISGNRRSILLFFRNIGKKRILEIENILLNNGFINPINDEDDLKQIYTTKYDDYIKQMRLKLKRQR